MKAHIIPTTFAIASLAGQDSKNLKNLKQLTNGGQNAEGYWAPDGKRWSSHPLANRISAARSSS